MRLSVSQKVDGLWIGVLDDKDGERLIQRVRNAILLIQRYDPLRYRQICASLRRIWMCDLIGNNGQYSRTFNRCDLDLRYVKSASLERIAATIVHEATHGHHCLRKIGYPEPLRHRIELICMRQELAFARTLPDGHALRAQIETNLARKPEEWSNQALRTRFLINANGAAKSAGLPDWATYFLLSLGARLGMVRRLLRRIKMPRKS
jgi:hypothetical protein